MAYLPISGASYPHVSDLEPAHQRKNAAKELRACRTGLVSPKIPSCWQRQRYEETEMPNNDACLVAESIR